MERDAIARTIQLEIRAPDLDEPVVRVDKDGPGARERLPDLVLNGVSFRPPSLRRR
ncbi:MAG: hypothetical protein WAK84_10605 [Candidatus Cybelea sp.]